jgi:hypothetical protein
MTILKRFDKNKNGVIVEEDFTTVLVKWVSYDTYYIYFLKKILLK